MFAIRFPKNIDKKLKDLEKLPDTFEKYVDDAGLAVAEEYKRRLIAHIDNQDLKWEKLSDKYLQYKINNNLSTNIWEATELLKESISVKKIDNVYFIGILNNEKYPDSDVSASLVASVLEYGSPSRNIPPRPLFRPTRIGMRRELKNFFNGKILLKYFRKG